MTGRDAVSCSEACQPAPVAGLCLAREYSLPTSSPQLLRAWLMMLFQHFSETLVIKNPLVEEELKRKHTGQ